MENDCEVMEFFYICTECNVLKKRADPMVRIDLFYAVVVLRMSSFMYLLNRTI